MKLGKIQHIAIHRKNNR